MRIERVRPRPGSAEEPLRTPSGYQLADPKFGADKHKARYAVFVDTIEDAADLIRGRGFHIWMKGDGKRASLICPASLRITAT